MNKYTCPLCDSHDGFLLMADYSASGLWCKKCGVSFGNPKKEFPKLPSGLVDLIDIWTGWWDEFASEDTKWNYGFNYNEYLSAGEYLSRLVNEFYPCFFEDR